MKEVYDKFGLEVTTRDFLGHAMALYTTDSYMTEKGKVPETVERMRLYGNSVARYGKSPYIYPLYGLGELPQGFARLSAIYGGTYMLNANIDEIKYEGDRATGISATMKERGDDGEGMKFSTKAKMIIGDPSYFPEKVEVVGHILKAICILTHPIANTHDSDSVQLIIPQSQIGRKNGKSFHIDRQRSTNHTNPHRHLHRNGLLRPQRLPQRLLHSNRLHHCRNRSKPPSRTRSRLRASRSHRREIHGCTNPTLRTQIRWQGGWSLHIKVI